MVKLLSASIYFLVAFVAYRVWGTISQLLLPPGFDFFRMPLEGAHVVTLIVIVGLFGGAMVIAEHLVQWVLKTPTAK